MTRRRRIQREDYIGFRLAPELRARVLELASMQGISPSEWMRSVVDAAVSASGLQGSTIEDQGYMAGRQLALKLVQAKVVEAVSELPTSYDDARDLIE